MRNIPTMRSLGTCFHIDLLLFKFLTIFDGSFWGIFGPIGLIRDGDGGHVFEQKWPDADASDLSLHGWLRGYRLLNCEVDDSCL